MSNSKKLLLVSSVNDYLALFISLKKNIMDKKKHTDFDFIYVDKMVEKISGSYDSQS